MAAPYGRLSACCARHLTLDFSRVSSYNKKPKKLRAHAPAVAVSKVTVACADSRCLNMAVADLSLNNLSKYLLKPNILVDISLQLTLQCFLSC